MDSIEAMIYYALLLFFIFDYLRPGSYVPGLDALRLNALIPIAAILGTLLGKTPVSNRQVFAETSTKLMVALLSLLVVSTVFATVTEYAYTVTKNVFAYMLIYWVLIRQVGDVRRLKGVFMMLAAVHIAVGMLNPALLIDPDNRVLINSGAFLGDGNDFSLSVNICIPLCLFLFSDATRKTEKTLWLGVLLALVMCVVATKSRGGTLALVAIGVYYWLKSTRKVMTASLALATLVIVLATAPPLYFERMSQMTDTEEGSAQGRIQAWKAGVQMAVKNPLLGTGAGHFPMAYGNASASRWTTAHSIYFLVIGELGIPGITVLLALIFTNLAANRRLSHEARRLPPAQALTASNLLSCTSASLVGLAVGGAFLSAAYYPHLYVLSGLLVAARHIVSIKLNAHKHSSVHEPAAPPIVPARRRPIEGVLSPEWRPRPFLGGTTSTGTGFDGSTR